MEVTEAVFDEILDKVLFRKKQVSTLLNLFNTRNACSCPSIFIYGQTATGKNYILENLFEKLKVELEVFTTSGKSASQTDSYPSQFEILRQL